MSEQRTPNPQPRPRPAAPAAPGRRRLRTAWQNTRERISRAHLPRPHVGKPSRKALAWTGGILTALALLITIIVAVWDWNWFRGPIARMASARMHREVTIAGDLRVHLFSWQPSATVAGVSIGNAPWATPTDKLGTFDNIALKIRLIPLLWGHLDIRRLQFDRPRLNLLADAKGRQNWDFSDGRDKTPMRLPPIRDFVVNDGHIDMKDVRRKITFHATLNASERLGERSRGFEMVGQGTINAAPFTMQVTGGPLLNIDRTRPYPFNAEIRAGRTYVTARGEVPRPFDFGQFHMATTARGPDLADIYPLTGVALPNTPPYNLHGRLSRQGQVWKIDGLGGRVGGSDLAGELSVTTGRVRPLLKADLRSNSLDFRDLGALLGGRAVTGAPGAPPPKVIAGPNRLFPDAPLDFTRIRAMDADVSYRANSIKNAPVRLASGSARVRLDNALLKVDPLRFQLPQGLVQGHVNLNARQATPVTDLDLRLSNARIENLVPVKFEGRPPLTGAVVGRAKLTGTGNSVHKALSAANGEVMAVAPGGEIRQSFAELAGVNVVKGLGLLSKHDTSTVPIRCGVAHFTARNGVLTADNLVVDTGPVLINGKGSINLSTEQMNLEARGHDKKFRLVRVLLPVTAEGPLNAPRLGVKPGAAIAQGGIAAALGTLVSPLAAILPFIDPGLAKDANCGALVAEAADGGAPVKSVRAAR